MATMYPIDAGTRSRLYVADLFFSATTAPPRDESPYADLAMTHHHALAHPHTPTGSDNDTASLEPLVSAWSPDRSPTRSPLGRLPSQPGER